MTWKHKADYIWLVSSVFPIHYTNVIFCVYFGWKGLETMIYNFSIKKIVNGIVINLSLNSENMKIKVIFTLIAGYWYVLLGFYILVF